MDVEFLVSDTTGKKIYLPAVQEGIEWSTQRRGAPGKLTFQIVQDDTVCLTEGAAVRLKVDGAPVFFGFLFAKRQDKDGLVRLTAYDQLRYLNNKDTYVYGNKTASQFLKMLAADFKLQTGEIEDTGFVIASRIEENTSLFDMVENALDLTLKNRGEMYVLYDDFGKLALKNISSMKVGKAGAYLLIDEETGENFEYASEIDSNTYNKIKLTYDNEKTGKREVYIAQDGGHINQWGVLQYYGTLQEGEDGQAKADALLKLYNSQTRNLKITCAVGDVRVRAGSMVAVKLNLDGVEMKNFMLVEKARHVFYLDRHTMELTLRGGEFVA